jgi:hypothetical protein
MDLFQSKDESFFWVSIPFYPWLHVCFLADQVRDISKTMLMQNVFDVSLAIVYIP